MTQQPPAPINIEIEVAEHYDVDSMSNDDMLLYARRLKMQLAESLTSNGVMPTEAKDVTALMGVINSIDKAALTTIRNEIEQDSNTNVAAAIGIIAGMQAQIGNRDPFMIDVDATAEPREVTLDQPLIETTFVEGELSHEVRDLQYDSFVEKYD